MKCVVCGSQAMESHYLCPECSSRREAATIQTKKGAIDVPCMNTLLVPADMVVANNYNPNNVPENNMQLLEESILSNGFCFPVATVWDPEMERFVVVDGFHRDEALTSRLQAEYVAIVVLKHDMAQRMASTVQFNRARGVHQVELMGELVQSLVQQGLKDEDIAQRLGMELEEVFRLKQITGIAELFKNQTYSRAWEMAEVDDE